jgi:hypothetical protein
MQAIAPDAAYVNIAAYKFITLRPQPTRRCAPSSA